VKKLISLIAALAMVSSLFVTTSFAAVPASATLNVDVTEADADQIAAYEENVDEVPSGYTLYAVSFSQTGLGDWANSNTKTTAAQLKKPTGWLASYIGFQIDFGSDIANIYEDTDFLFVESAYDFGVSIADDTKLTLQFGPWTNAANYPINAKGTDVLEEGEAIAVLYLPVSDSATGTFTDMTVIDMCEYLDGAPQELEGGGTDKEYSLVNENITFPASVSIGSVEEPTTQYTITFKDWDNTELTGSGTYDEGATVTAPTPSREGYTFTGWSPAFSGTATADAVYVAQYVEATPADVNPTTFKAYNKGATDNTDVKGNSVGEYTYNYGAAKFNNVTIEDSKYIYKLIAKSGELESDPIAIGTGNIEVQGTMSFMAIIKSATKAITGIVLRAIAK
jgi:hypothetical protein